MAAGASALAVAITSQFGSYLTDLDSLLSVPLALGAVGMILLLVSHAMRG